METFLLEFKHFQKGTISRIFVYKLKQKSSMLRPAPFFVF